MLSIDPSRRLTADGCLQHAFFKDQLPTRINLKLDHPMPSKTVIEQRDPDFDLINDIEEEFNHHMKKNESRAFATKQQVDTLPRNDGVPDSIPKQHMQSIPTISQANISFAQTRN